MKRRIVIGASVAAVAVAVAGGAAAVASASAGGNEGGVTGAEADKAIAAALAETGGGTANSVELDNENGATWEVEVTRPDGTTVDVRLDAAFAVVVVEGDSEPAGGEPSEVDDPATDDDDPTEVNGEDPPGTPEDADPPGEVDDADPNDTDD
jgi:hypothetical protein